MYFFFSDSLLLYTFLHLIASSGCIIYNWSKPKPQRKKKVCEAWKTYDKMSERVIILSNFTIVRISLNWQLERGSNQSRNEEATWTIGSYQHSTKNSCIQSLIFVPPEHDIAYFLPWFSRIILTLFFQHEKTSGGSKRS